VGRPHLSYLGKKLSRQAAGLRALHAAHPYRPVCQVRSQTNLLYLVLLPGSRPWSICGGAVVRNFPYSARRGRTANVHLRLVFIDPYDVALRLRLFAGWCCFSFGRRFLPLAGMAANTAPASTRESKSQGTLHLHPSI